MTNGLTRPLQQQQQSLPRSQSTTPSTTRKNAPSPTPQFDARKLRNGMQSVENYLKLSHLNFHDKNTCNPLPSAASCKASGASNGFGGRGGRP